MRLTMRSPESNTALALAALGGVAFNLIYFVIALPASRILLPDYFAVSYAIWGVVGVYLILREDYSVRHKTKRMFQIFTLMIFGSLIFTAVSPFGLFLYGLTFSLAFMGFYIGVGVAACAILAYRLKYPNRPQKPIDYKW